MSVDHFRRIGIGCAILKGGWQAGNVERLTFVNQLLENGYKENDFNLRQHPRWEEVIGVLRADKLRVHLAEALEREFPLPPFDPTHGFPVGRVEFRHNGAADFSVPFGYCALGVWFFDGWVPPYPDWDSMRADVRKAISRGQTQGTWDVDYEWRTFFRAGVVLKPLKEGV